jgi:hypothetical protein
MWANPCAPSCSSRQRRAIAEPRPFLRSGRAPTPSGSGRSLSLPPKKHPDFKMTERGLQYRGKLDLPANVNVWILDLDNYAGWLIDWFQRTYPLEARAIEAGIA